MGPVTAILLAPAALVVAALVSRTRFRGDWDVGQGRGAAALSLSLCGGAVHFRWARLGPRRKSRWLLFGRPLPQRRATRRARGGAAAAPGRRVAALAGRRRSGARKPGAHFPVTALWRHRDLVATWARLAGGAVVRISRRIAFEPATLSITVGLGDPAETGAVYGLVWSLLSALVPRVPFRRLSVAGHWVDLTFASTGRVGLSLRPIWLPATLAWLAVRVPWRRTWRAVREARRAPARAMDDRSDARPA